MIKFKEWFLNGGREMCEFILWWLGYFMCVMIIWLFASMIRSLPEFYESLVSKLIELGGTTP